MKRLFASAAALAFCVISIIFYCCWTVTLHRSTAFAASAAAPGAAWSISLLRTSSDSQVATTNAFPSVVILTPTKNARRHVGRLLGLLGNLTYPKRLISLAFLDSDSDDSASAVEEAEVATLAAAGVLPGFTTAHERGALRASSRASWRATGSLYALLRAVPSVRAAGFASLRIFQRDFGLPLPKGDRHAPEFQLARREVLARSRNTLLAAGLRDEDWALWIDSDVAELPSDLIEQLLSSGKDIVVPNVVMKHGGRSYDLNSWRAGKLHTRQRERRPGDGAADATNAEADVDAVETLLGDRATVASVRSYHDAVHAAEVAAGRARALQLEGYGNEAGHLYLHHLRSHCDGRGRETEGRAHLSAASGALPSPSRSPCVVRLDAVGGAVLLVRGDLHRQGLVFPPFPFRHRIETEGLSMMALDMGVLSWGMPLLEVIHH